MNNIDAIKLREIKKMEERLFSIIDSFHKTKDNLKLVEREKFIKEIDKLNFQYSNISL